MTQYDDIKEQAALVDFDDVSSTDKKQRRGAGRPRVSGSGNEKNPYRWKRAEYWREQGRERSRRKYAARSEWRDAVKSALGCQICGNQVPAALEFHHIERDAKRFSVSRSITSGADGLLAEIGKCALLCATCHRNLEHSEAFTDLQPIDTKALPPIPRFTR